MSTNEYGNIFQWYNQLRKENSDVVPLDKKNSFLLKSPLMDRTCKLSRNIIQMHLKFQGDEDKQAEIDIFEEYVLRVGSCEDVIIETSRRPNSEYVDNEYFFEIPVYGSGDLLSYVVDLELYHESTRGRNTALCWYADLQSHDSELVPIRKGKTDFSLFDTVMRRKCTVRRGSLDVHITPSAGFLSGSDLEDIKAYVDRLKADETIAVQRIGGNIGEYMCSIPITSYHNLQQTLYHFDLSKRHLED